MKILTTLIVSLLFTTIINAEELQPTQFLLPYQTFELPEQKIEELGEPTILWATNYYIPYYQDKTGDFSLRDINGNELGPKLSLRSWCMSALEGSVRIALEDGTTKVFNYHASTEPFPVDCSTELPFDLSKTKFRESKSLFGEGVDGNILAPYRTIATDTSKIPVGTVLYIPEARGLKIKLGDTIVIHDGYFFAGDRGGAIKDNHIDVFTGVSKGTSFFPWIGHNAEKLFNAYLIKDPSIIDTLKKLHRSRSL